MSNPKIIHLLWRLLYPSNNFLIQVEQYLILNLDMIKHQTKVKFDILPDRIHKLHYG